MTSGIRHRVSDNAGAGPRGAAGVPEPGGRVHLLYDEFLTAVSPAPTTRTCEPGPGTLSILDGATPIMSISNGKFVVNGTPSVGSRRIATASAYQRVAGRLWEITVFEVTTSGTLRIGLDTAVDNLPQYRIDYGGGTTTVNIIDGSTGSPINILVSLSVGSTPHQWRFVTLDTGCYLFEGTDLIWRFDAATFTPIFLYSWLNDAVAYDFKLEDYDIRDVGGAIGADAFAAIDSTSFNQTLGSELVANGTFPDLTGWSALSTPVTFEAVGGRMHLVTNSSGDGATSSNFSPALGTGWYQGGFDYELVAGQFAALITTNTAGFQPGTFTALGSRTFKGVWLNNNALGRASQFVTNVATASEYFIDNLTLKAMNGNAADTAPSPDGIWEFGYTLPADPGGGEVVLEMVRWQDDLNCWVAGVQRNNGDTNYDFFLNSGVAGTFTSRISVTGIGDSDRVRVSTNGNLWNAYTFLAGVPTKRGGEVNNSTHAAQVGFRTLYVDTITPLRRRMWAKTSTLYSELNG